MTDARIVRHLRAIAQQAGPHGLAYITKWQAERAADEIEQLSRRVAELETAAVAPTLFDQPPKETRG